MSQITTLWLKHRPIAHHVARDYFIPGSEPQDVRQEALIALWEAATAYDKEKGAFPAFARLVIHRRLSDAVKAARREKHRMLTEADRSRPETIVAGEAAQLPDLSTLTPAERRAVVGVAAGMAYAELGEPKKIDNALSRARRKLRAA